MKLLTNKLYLELIELVECGISGNTVWKASERKSVSWDIIQHPDDGRKILVGYDQLKEEYKIKVRARYGDPYNYVAKAPIYQMIVSNLEAEQFFLSYRYEGNKMLPEERVRQYTREACWLTMLQKADANMKEVRKNLGLRWEDFYKNVGEMIEQEKEAKKITGKFPSTYIKLKARMRAYKENGFSSLIAGQYGNKSAAKVADEFSEALLLEMIAHPNQYDDVLVAYEYNKQVIQQGYKPITAQTVGVWRRKSGHLVTAGREGWAAFDDKYRKQIAGRRPSAPLYLVESDDNHLDYLFLDMEDMTGSKFFHRYKAIIVIDSFNDYVLGYAYAEELSIELVKAAYVNALYHIRELTGGWYLPHETRTDNWALASLQTFYESLGHFHKSPVGSKKRGYIEQCFGTAHFKRCMKLGANNYTGNNLTAINRGVNTEVLAANRKLYPKVQDGAMQQIESFFHRLRTIPAKGSISKQAEWLTAWNMLPDTDKRAITDEQFLQKFGIIHKPGGRGVTINNLGIPVQITGQKLLFDVPANLHMQIIGKTVNVVYDPMDVSRVLVTDNSGLRFIATQTRLAPKAIRDMQPGDRSYLNELLAQKKEQSGRVANASEKRKSTLIEKGIDPESLLQAGVMDKTLKQMAEVSIQSRIGLGYNQEDEDFDPLSQM